MRRNLTRLARTALGMASIACAGSDDVRHTTTRRESGAAAPPAAASPPPPAAVNVAPSLAIRIALDGDGLIFVDTSGSTRSVAFGVSETRVLTAAAAALGDPRDRSTNRDCGAGPVDFVSFEGGLLVNLQGGKFVGWTVRPAGGREPRTMSGIGLGSTRTELEAAYAAEVANSSIGMEFSAGGLSGVLASSDATAPVTDLWAGTNCIAR